MSLNWSIFTSRANTTDRNLVLKYVYTFLVMILLHSLCEVKSWRDGIHDKCLHEVCESKINSCVVHDLTLTTPLTYCRREGDSVRSRRSVSRRRGTSGCWWSSCIRSAIVWKATYCHCKNGPLVPQNYFFDNKKTSWNLFYCNIIPVGGVVVPEVIIPLRPPPRDERFCKTLNASISKLYRRCRDSVKVLWCH